MKVKVINKNTNQQFDCEEIIIDGFKYYINSSNKDFKTNELSVYKKWKLGIVTNVNEDILEFEGEFIDESNLYKIICCNNPNIDIPQVVNKIDLTKLCFYDRRNPDFSIKEEYGYDKEEVEATGNFAKKDCACDDCFYGRSQLTEQLIKSQEMFPFTEEDMIEFAEFVAKYTDKNKNYKSEILHAKSKYDGAERTIDLLQLWKQQQPKIIYYNE